jgi:hypothetical protein
MATIAAAIIGAGATVYASRQANKRSKRQKAMEDLMAKNARLSGDYGERMLGRSEEALASVYERFRKLAGGDRTKLMEYLKPELERQSAAARGAYQSAAEFSPRSGLNVEANSRIPIDNAASIARMLNSGRAEGIRGLENLGSEWGRVGMAGLQQGAGGASDFLGYERQRRNDASAAGADAGASAFALWKMFQDAQAGRQTAGGAGAGTGAGAAGYGGNTQDMFNFWGRGQ